MKTSWYVRSSRWRALLPQICLDELLDAVMESPVRHHRISRLESRVELIGRAEGCPRVVVLERDDPLIEEPDRLAPFLQPRDRDWTIWIGGRDRGDGDCTELRVEIGLSVGDQRQEPHGLADEAIGGPLGPPRGLVLLLGLYPTDGGREFLLVGG